MRGWCYLHLPLLVEHGQVRLEVKILRLYHSLLLLVQGAAASTLKHRVLLRMDFLEVKTTSHRHSINVLINIFSESLNRTTCFW